jgi:Domain of unknown function (DUF4129)
MTGFWRWWDDAVAALGDVVPLPLLALLVVLLAALVAALWATYPRWVRRPRLRLRRRRRTAEEPADDALEALAEAALPDDALPDLPAPTLVSLADRLAAQGRFAEAVRERLRAIVRLLVDRRVIEHHPGWTVTELAAAAGQVRPAADAPLRDAGRVFSDIWYGERPATADDDARMRVLAGQVDAAVAVRSTVEVSR